MKHIIILGDGMADWPAPQLNGLTLLEYAHTPNMNRLARMGRCGTLITVPTGMHPGSEVANMSIMGYDVRRVYEGRAVLEAASMGIGLDDDDLALRCNLISLEGALLKNHSAGHITTAEATQLIDSLNEALGTERVKFYTGVQYRHLLVVKGGNKHLIITPPHDVPMQPWEPLMVKAERPEAKATAKELNRLIVNSQNVLQQHPVNLRRRLEGKDMADSVWLWSPGYRPKMEPLRIKYPAIKRGSVISAVDLINGIGRYAGLKCIHVDGATGLYDTNYENKVNAALKALETDDFVYLHIEASDEAGHEGSFELKQRTIEDLDHRVVGPIMEGAAQMKQSVCITLLPDHPTPCQLRTHTAEPVPFAYYYDGIAADMVQTFGERTCQAGACGQLKDDELMNLLMSIDE